jgi:LCP family protein required for cell wall assembly
VVSARLVRLVAGKIGYAVSCLLAVVVVATSWYAHQVVSQVTQLAKGISTGSAPSVGAMNVLVMGLESRTDYHGNVLSPALLAAMHAGKYSAIAAGDESSQDTNTLILIHIFAGGQKAYGFSIPRDDLVKYPKEYFPGVTEGKIDGAYYFAYVTFLNQNPNMPKAARYLGANQAGEGAEIATVESVTGQPVSHFVETNLGGFFTLAQDFGGTEVCVKPWPGGKGLAPEENLSDGASGWDAVKYDGYNLKKSGLQYLHLAADQSLAFVRARDSLPGTDLGRTSRQQAVIDYVIWELKHEGAFTDVSKITGLLGAASQWVITDQHLNLLDFATNMRALTGKNLTFQTLPVAGYLNNMELNGAPQDVNVISLPYIQRTVKNAFYPPSAVKKTLPAKKGTAKKTAPIPAASTVTVDVYNGDLYAGGLAAKDSQALASLGYQAGAVLEASAQSQTVATGTQVFFGAGTSANAAKIAKYFGTAPTALTSLTAGHVAVLIGSASTVVPAGLASAASPTASTGTAGPSTATPAPESSAGGNNGDAGGALKVPANAKYGIPCVY